jgi:hypothetical protein
VRVRGQLQRGGAQHRSHARERAVKRSRSRSPVTVVPWYRKVTSYETRNEKRSVITPKLAFKNLNNRTTILPVQKRIL